MKSLIQIKKIGQNVVSIEHKKIKNLVGKIDDDFIFAIEFISESNGRFIVAGFWKKNTDFKTYYLKIK